MIARFVASAMLAAATLTGACGSDPQVEPEPSLCDPGENIFCRCPGGDPGTKQCNETGDGFGACDYCEERGGDVASGGPGATTGGVGGGGTGDLALLHSCTSSAECASGLCPVSYTHLVGRSVSGLTLRRNHFRSLLNQRRIWRYDPARPRSPHEWPAFC